MQSSADQGWAPMKVPQPEDRGNFVCWSRTTVTDSWNWPFKLTSSVYRREICVEIVRSLGKAVITTPNTFEMGAVEFSMKGRLFSTRGSRMFAARPLSACPKRPVSSCTRLTLSKLIARAVPREIPQRWRQSTLILFSRKGASWTSITTESESSTAATSVILCSRDRKRVPNCSFQPVRRRESSRRFSVGCACTH